MRTRVTVVCLYVCYQSPGSFSHLYDKLDLPTCSSLAFLGFQQTDFDKTVLFKRQSAFHGYFDVNSSVYYLWSVTPACAILFLPAQQIRSIDIMNGLSHSVGVWPM